MKFLSVLVLLSSGVAAAEPRFEVIDRGSAIEVVAYEVKAARTAITPARSRLEIDLVGLPKINPLTPTDKGVKVIELDGANPRRLSVKLPFERPEVKMVAKFAQAIQVGDDLHLLFPREVPVEGARVVLPEPTLPKHIETKLGPQPLEPQPAAKSETPVAKTEPVQPKVPDAKPVQPDNPKAFLAPEEPSGNFSMYAMGGLGAIALGIYLVKKKKTAIAAPASTIEVIAQKSLGAKAKVVWLNAGGREMVVAVTPQAVRMLGQWKKSDAPSVSMAGPANMPFAQALENVRTERPARAATSSPVAGILKLRERAGTYEGVSEDVATDDMDADAVWAKEILAATNGGRR